MYRTLKPNQRKFLEYLRDNHNSLGWIARIKRILESGTYSTDENGANSVQCILKNWKGILRDDVPAETLKYGKPTKYLK